MIGGYVGLDIGGRNPRDDIREADAVAAGVATVTGVGLWTHGAAGAAAGVATVAMVGEGLLILRREITETINKLQLPVDAAMAEDADRKQRRISPAPRQVARHIARSIFRE